MLARDPCTRLLDGYKVKMTGKNCPNYTIKDEMYAQLCKKYKKIGRYLILAKTALSTQILSADSQVWRDKNPRDIL